MCHRISPLLIQELREALDELQQSGRPRLPRRDPNLVVPDAYPGRQLPLFVTNERGELDAVELTWGFTTTVGGKEKLVFNTRIETALSQARAGRGLWAEPLLRGRCLVPVRSFYESWTVSPPQRGAQVRFTSPAHQVFLLAGVWQGERVSVVTTSPNASVAPMHTRMPLVLGPGESSAWLGPDFAQLADRSGIVLNAEPELPPEPQAALELNL
jgi:putative SOS response-associated peptidase YedK